MAILDIGMGHLAVLNLYVSPMPPTKFQLNPTYSSGADVVLRLPRWPSWWPFWILEQNELSNFKSQCHPYASYQVWAQSDLPFGSRHGLKIFMMATTTAIMDVRTEQILAILNLYLLECLPSSFCSIQLIFWEEIFKMATMLAILDTETQGFYQASPWLIHTSDSQKA